MKLLIIIPSLFLYLIASAQHSYISNKLIKKWQTPAELKTPESVYYDTERNIIYVSNIAGGPSDKDINGFISTLSTDGKILQIEWCKGLNAPKGIGIVGNYLFVADIDEIVKIDIQKQKIIQRYPIKDAKFLNDITTEAEGVIYVSDMNGNAIYRIKNSVVELFVKSDFLNQPNGLYTERNLLYVGLRDRIVTINIKSKEIKDYILNTGSIEGIISDGNGNFIISDWLGNIHLVNPNNHNEKLLDTTPEKVNAADIEYVIGKKLLLVPTFSDNRIMAYELR